MMRTAGVECDRDEFYLYEGMTGKATIDLLFRRTFGHGVSDEEAKRLYAIKTERFRSYGPAPLIEGADRMLRALGELGLIRVLVTGSAQSSLLDNIDRAYPGVFPPGRRITANDVTHGKPNPEPYLKGGGDRRGRARGMHRGGERTARRTRGQSRRLLHRGGDHRPSFHARHSGKRGRHHLRFHAGIRRMARKDGRNLGRHRFRTTHLRQ